MDLSQDQIQKIQQYLQQNPSSKGTLVQQLQSQGYNLPPEIQGGNSGSNQQSQQTQGIGPAAGSMFPYTPTGNDAGDVLTGGAEAIGNLITGAPAQLWGMGKGIVSALSSGAQPDALGNVSIEQQLKGLENNPLIRMAVGGVNTAGQGIFHALGGDKNTTTQSALKGVLPNSFLNWVQGDTDTANNILSYYHAKYLGGFKNGPQAGFENVMNSVVNDPWGTALDLSAILSAGSGLAGKIGQAGEVSDIAKAGAIADKGGSIAEMADAGGSSPASKIGQIAGPLETAAKWTNPISPLLGLGGKIIQAIGSKLSSSAVEGNAILDAARNISTETGVGIEDKLTEGMKGGKISRMLEAVAGSSIGATNMIERVDKAVGAVQTAASEFGKGLMTYLGVGSPEELWTGVKNLQAKIFDTETGEFKAQQQIFKDFKAKYADVSVDMTPVMDSIAKQTSSGVKAISDSVQTWLKKQTKILGGAFGSTGGDPLNSLLKSSDENLTTLVEYLRKSGQSDEAILANSSVKSMAEKAGIDLQQVSQTGATLPFEQAHNFYLKLNKAIADAEGTDKYMLMETKRAMQDVMGDSMKNVDDKSFKTWQTINATFGSAKQVVGDSVFKTLTNASVDPIKIVDAFFGKNSLQKLKDLQGIIAPEDFKQFAQYGLAKQVMDAFSNISENDPLGKGIQNFARNIDKVGMSTWKQVLDPESFANLEKFNSLSGDFDTLIKQGVRGAQKLSEGSRTTPLYQGFRYVRAAEEVSAAFLWSGGNVYHAAVNFARLFLGDIAFSKIIASDFGQKLLGTDIHGAGLPLQNFGSSMQSVGGSGLSAGMRAATITGQVKQPTNSTNTLTDQQIQSIKQRIQQNPQEKDAMMSTLQSQGYDVSRLQ